MASEATGRPPLHGAMRSALVVVAVSAAAIVLATFAVAPTVNAIFRRLPLEWVARNGESFGIAIGLAANSVVALVAGVAVAFLAPTRPVILALAVALVLAIVGIAANPVTQEQAGLRAAAYLMATGVAMLAAYFTAILLARRRSRAG